MTSMRDVEVQKMVDVAEDLRKVGRYQEAVKYYLDAMKLAREDWQEGVKDESWQKKVIFMACNGMGIAYAKWGKPTDALESFQDALTYAPDEASKRVAEDNLARYRGALEKRKTSQS